MYTSLIASYLHVVKKSINLISLILIWFRLCEKSSFCLWLSESIKRIGTG